MEIQTALRKIGRLSAVAVLSAAALTGVAQADVVRAKGDAFVRRAAASHPRRGWSRLIVQTHGPLTPARLHRIAALQGDIYRHYRILDAVAVAVPSRNLDALARLPFVSRISADALVRRTGDVQAQAGGVRRTAPGGSARYGDLLSPVTIAVVDSGVAFHPDFQRPDGASRILAQRNFTGRPSEYDDLCGHGTHVAGVAAGNGAASAGPDCFQTFRGVAPTADLVNLRVLDDQGVGTVSNALAAIQWCVENRSAYNIRVMNLSLGHTVGESYRTDPLCQAVESAWKSGIVVVCAAGNGGRLHETASSGLDNEGWGSAYGSIQSPGNDPYVITVGALKRSASGPRVATYSSRGPSRLDFVLKPDIVAPGNKVIAPMAGLGAYLVRQYRKTNQVPLSEYRTDGTVQPSGYYFVLSGTSIAAPAVSGAAAALLQSDAGLTPDTVKARLMTTADKLAFPDGTPDPLTFGAGALNLDAALSSTLVATAPALSPQLALDGAGNMVAIVGVEPGDTLWGGLTNLQAIWGSGVRQALWGSTSVWSLATRQALWGSQAIWGNQALWGVSTGAVDITLTAIGGDR